MSDTQADASPVWMAVPHPMVALLNRLMALPKGIHTVVLVKSGNGVAGVACWAVTEEKMEAARKTLSGSA